MSSKTICCSCSNASEPIHTKSSSTPSVCPDCKCKPNTCNPACEEAKSSKNCPRTSKIPVRKNSTLGSRVNISLTTCRGSEVGPELNKASTLTIVGDKYVELPACDVCECEPSNCNDACLAKKATLSTLTTVPEGKSDGVPKVNKPVVIGEEKDKIDNEGVSKDPKSNASIGHKESSSRASEDCGCSKICKYCTCDPGTCNPACEAAKKERITKFMNKTRGDVSAADSKSADASTQLSKNKVCKDCKCPEGKCNRECLAHKTALAAVSETESAEKATTGVEEVPAKEQFPGACDSQCKSLKKSSLKLRSSEHLEAGDKTEKNVTIKSKSACDLCCKASKRSSTKKSDKEILTVKSKSTLCESCSRNLDECESVCIKGTQSEPNLPATGKKTSSQGVSAPKEGDGKKGEPKKVEEKKTVPCEVCDCNDPPCHKVCEEVMKLKALVEKSTPKVCDKCVCEPDSCNETCKEKRDKATEVNLNEKPLTIDACVECRCPPEVICSDTCTKHKNAKQSKSLPINLRGSEDTASNPRLDKIPEDVCVCTAPCIPTCAKNKKSSPQGDKKNLETDSCTCKSPCDPACDSTKVSEECTCKGPCDSQCKQSGKGKSTQASGESVQELTELLGKIKCSCLEAESMTQNKPAKKTQSSSSEMRMVLEIFNKKCKMKDIFINAMIKDLSERSASKQFDSLLGDIAHDSQSVADFDRTAITNALPRPPGMTNGRTSRQCRCSAQTRGAGIISITVAKKVGCSSLLVRWTASKDVSVTGYEVYIEGKVRGRVFDRLRTSVLMDCMNLQRCFTIEVYAMVKYDRLEPPAVSMYEP